MGILAEEFIRRNGLEHAFVAHLEAQAAVENKASLEDEGPA